MLWEKLDHRWQQQLTMPYWLLSTKVRVSISIWDTCSPYLEFMNVRCQWELVLKLTQKRSTWETNRKVGNLKRLAGVCINGGVCGLIRQYSWNLTNRRGLSVKVVRAALTRASQVLHGCRQFVLWNFILSYVTDETPSRMFIRVY